MYPHTVFLAFIWADLASGMFFYLDETKFFALGYFSWPGIDVQVHFTRTVKHGMNVVKCIWTHVPPDTLNF